MRRAIPSSILRLLLSLSLLAGCTKKNEATTGDASSSAEDAAPVTSVASPAPPPSASAGERSAPDASFTLTKVTPVEARRVKALSKWADDPALMGASEVLDKHFGSPAQVPPKRFDLQAAPLTAQGRRAVLVMESGKPTSDANPYLLVADDKRVLWTRDRPIGGIMAPVGPVAIAAAPQGRVALAACDPPTAIVALRIFDDDGSPFADFQAITGMDTCDALSLLYWPRHGWVLAAAKVGATKLQLLNESGAQMWSGASGLDLGARSPRAGAIAAPVLAADTDDTIVMVQIVQPSTVEGSAFHALAFRYDAHGTAIWPAAVDLGEVKPQPAERAKLAPIQPGVHVTLPNHVELDLKPSGDIVNKRP